MKKVILLLSLFTILTPYTPSQWVQQTVPVSKPITGIKFIDSLTGWACTSLGTGGLNYAYILHTTNGGTNWFIQDSSFNSDYSALSVIDNNIVYAGGDSVGYGKLAKTTNGGLNWYYLQLPINMLIGDMQFLNKDSGWTCVNLFGADVRTTTNGGLNWTVRTNGIMSQTQRIFFLNYDTGFCGAYTYLYKTTNAGLNWTQLAHFMNDVKSIYFFNETSGWIGAAISTFYKTTNSGLNWDTISLSPSIFGNITDLQFITPTRGYGGNRTLRILVTTNGGLNWGYQIDSSASYKISFIDTLHGWSGDAGISKTTNGGGPIINVGIININTNVPNSFKLYQNYPNPFNPVTVIKYQITNQTHIMLIVYDVLGREVKTLIDAEQRAGIYLVDWDAENLPGGIYFYKLTADKFFETKKMVLVK